MTRYLYEDVELYSPGKMTDLRSALVNNYLFSVITVRNGFHHYLKHLNNNLQASIDKFIQRQEECDHIVLDEVMKTNSLLCYRSLYSFTSVLTVDVNRL